MRSASRLDVKAVIDRLDLDGIVDSVDLERQIDRVDLLKIADQVIEGVDLPQMIRESTGSLSTEAVHGARVQGMQADDAVAGFVGRFVRPRQRTTLTRAASGHERR